MKSLADELRFKVLLRQMKLLGVTCLIEPPASCHCGARAPSSHHGSWRSWTPSSARACDQMPSRDPRWAIESALHRCGYLYEAAVCKSSASSQCWRVYPPQLTATVHPAPSPPTP